LGWLERFFDPHLPVSRKGVLFPQRPPRQCDLNNQRQRRRRIPPNPLQPVWQPRLEQRTRRHRLQLHTPFGAQAGQRLESGFGLLGYHARYYDPYLNRFVSSDTIVPDFSNPQSLNRYTYALNNPVKYNDPSGHCVWDACIVEGALIGAGVALAIDFAVQVKQNMDAGMSFWDAGYHQNVNTQELAGATLLGVASGAAVGYTAVAAAPSLTKAAVQANQFLQTPAGQITQGAGESVADDCFDGCTPQSAAASAVTGAAVSAIPYAQRIRQRAIESPGGHNFPYSFDEAILSTDPTTLNSGAQGYALRGYKNSTKVVYNIIVDDGVITHRDLVNVNKWPQRQKSFGWPINLENIPDMVSLGE